MTPTELERAAEKDIHVMPDDGKHKCSSECFCMPTKAYTDEITKKNVWIHKSPEELCQ